MPEEVQSARADNELPTISKEKYDKTQEQNEVQSNKSQKSSASKTKKK
jgi:hypothetical protein